MNIIWNLVIHSATRNQRWIVTSKRIKQRSLTLNHRDFFFLIIWPNYSDLTRVFTPNGGLVMEIPFISGKSRFVKYYILARIITIFWGTQKKNQQNMTPWQGSVFMSPSQIDFFFWAQVFLEPQPESPWKLMLRRVVFLSSGPFAVRFREGYCSWFSHKIKHKIQIDGSN